jgi:hypothetical protein
VSGAAESYELGPTAVWHLSAMAAARGIVGSRTITGEGGLEQAGTRPLAKVLDVIALGSDRGMIKHG